MNYKRAFNFIVILILVANFAAAKPLIMQNSQYIKEFPSQPKETIKNHINLHDVNPKFSLSILSPIHKLIKRYALAYGEKSSSNTGFAAIITSPQQKDVPKKRKCLDWEKEPIIDRWRCIKFNIKQT